MEAFSSEVDLPEWSDEDLPHPDFPIERFFESLESKMVMNLSNFAINGWAQREYKLPPKTVKKFKAVILHSWRYERQTSDERYSRRENVRRKLEELYELCKSKGDLRLAHDVVRTMADLDGLKSPDVNLTQINQVVNGVGTQQITNRTRERVAELMETMRLRADQRALRADDKLLPTEAQIPGQPKNGNGSNGHG